MITRRTALGSLLAASSAPFILTDVLGQDAYPSKAIHSICSFTAGSGADIIVRLYSNKLQEICGKPVIVENKIGAAGNLGTEYVARSRPDGYMIYINPGSNVLAAAPSFFKNLSFDPVEDFEHVTTMHRSPGFLVVSSESPYKTVADLVADMKAKGDKSGYAGISNTATVLCEMVKAQFGLATAEIRFRDFPSALREMGTGAVSFTYLDATQTLGHLNAGRIRVLASTSAERPATIPAHIPTSHEAGVDMDNMSWWSVQVAKGTPQPIVDQLTKYFHSVLAQDDIKQFLARVWAVTIPADSSTTKALVKKEVAAWGAYAKIAKVEPQ